MELFPALRLGWLNGWVLQHFSILAEEQACLFGRRFIGHLPGRGEGRPFDAERPDLWVGPPLVEDRPVQGAGFLGQHGTGKAQRPHPDS